MLTEKEKQILTSLLEKYNGVLLESMRIALAEDLWNLIISNRDDSNFDLRGLMDKKEEFKTFVTGQFLRQNSSPVLYELKYMEDRLDEVSKSTRKAPDAGEDQVSEDQ